MLQNFIWLSDGKDEIELEEEEEQRLRFAETRKHHQQQYSEHYQDVSDNDRESVRAIRDQIANDTWNNDYISN